jgi:hypothetical protein
MSILDAADLVLIESIPARSRTDWNGYEEIDPLEGNGSDMSGGYGVEETASINTATQRPAPEACHW